MSVNLQLALDPPLARLRITGDLDMVVHDQLRDLVRCLREVGCDRVELDLDAVTFVDAGSLRLLDQQQRLLETDGGSLEVVAASETFLLISDLAGYPELQPSPFDTPRPRLLRGGLGADALGLRGF